VVAGVRVQVMGNPGSVYPLLSLQGLILLLLRDDDDYDDYDDDDDDDDDDDNSIQFIYSCA
jgi:hypothetical protein